MGAAAVLHKSQKVKGVKGDAPLFRDPLRTPRGKRVPKKGCVPFSLQCASEPAARRISGAVTCDSSLR